MSNSLNINSSQESIQSYNYLLVGSMVVTIGITSICVLGLLQAFHPFYCSHFANMIGTVSPSYLYGLGMAACLTEIALISISGYRQNQLYAKDDVTLEQSIYPTSSTDQKILAGFQSHPELASKYPNLLMGRYEICSNEKDYFVVYNHPTRGILTRQALTLFDQSLVEGFLMSEGQAVLKKLWGKFGENFNFINIIKSQFKDLPSNHFNVVKNGNDRAVVYKSKTGHLTCTSWMSIQETQVIAQFLKEYGVLEQEEAEHDNH